MLDSEAKITKGPGGETHTFRVAATSIDRMSRKSDDWQATKLAVHDSIGALWDWVSDNCKPRERTVLVAHNLGYDLRICDALNALPERGWAIEALSLAPGSTWLKWRRDGATLEMVDSLTWLPMTLDRIGKLIGMEKASLPRSNAPERAWVERCTSDVAILREAWLRVVKWLRAEDLGNWRPTGAGQSWSAWRHRFMTHKILLHGDDEIRAVERKAGWTGRAEAWRFGRQTDGPWTEWDFQCAYATIAQERDVPTRLIGEMRNATAERVVRAAQRYGVLVECHVSTDAPTLPTFHDGRVVWPVGDFDTTVWADEVDMAVRHGATVTVSRAWLYHKEPALKAWADWTLGLIYDGYGDADPVVRTVAKHWSRALVGRFGTRFSTWTDYGRARQSTARLSGFSDYASGRSTQLLEVGGRAWVASGVSDHPLAAPQVMSFIMSQCRIRLWHAMNIAGLSNVVYIDTDSLIVNEAGSERLQAERMPGLRRKASYQSLDIMGTRRLVEDRQLKMAGVPSASRRLGPRTWAAETWDTLQGSISTGSADAVRVVERRVRIRDTDSRRRRLPGGGSEPWRISNGG